MGLQGRGDRYSIEQFEEGHHAHIHATRFVARIQAQSMHVFVVFDCCRFALHFVQEYDKWIVGKQIYESIIGDEKEFQAAVTKTFDICNPQINTAATTKLELMYFNALLNMDKSDGMAEVKKQDREYGARFRIRKEDFVHTSLLKKRNDYFRAQ